MEAVLDYYNRTPRVSLGNAQLQIDPKLMQAVQAVPVQQASQQSAQQDPAAQEQAIIQQAMQEQNARRAQQQQAAGMGVQIQPQGDQVLFPYDEYEQNRNLTLKQRRDAWAKVNAHLARPDIIIQPEHVIKNARAAYESDINQMYPEMPEFEKARPEVANLTKQIQEATVKRLGHLSKLRSQIEFVDYDKKPNESEKEWEDRVATTLKSQLKIYNTALVGTSDALANQERASLSPELNEDLFEPRKWFKIGGGSAVRSNIAGFKEKMKTLHDIITNEMNDAYNTLAGQTSPKYADQSLGFQQFQPYQSLPYRPRISYNAPADVIRGTRSMGQAFFERKAEMDSASAKYNQLMQRLVSEQGATPEQARSIVSRKFQQEFGVSLPAPVMQQKNSNK